MLQIDLFESSQQNPAKHQARGIEQKQYHVTPSDSTESVIFLYWCIANKKEKGKLGPCYEWKIAPHISENKYFGKYFAQLMQLF